MLSRLHSEWKGFDANLRQLGLKIVTAIHTYFTLYQDVKYQHIYLK